jgi:long-subunit fatty acid transport protein
MGNAAVGVAEDYSAIFWNPAGLAQLRNYEFSAGLSFLGYSNGTRFLGAKTDASNSVLNLNNLGIVYPVPTARGSLTFAFGFNRVSSYSTKTEFSGFNTSSSIVPSMIPDVDLWGVSSASADDYLNDNIPYQLFLADTLNGRFVTSILDSVQQSATISEGGGVNHWSFGGAIDVAKDLSLGMTVSLVTGSYVYDREFRENDTRNVYQKAPGDTYGLFDEFSYVSTINSDLTGFNALFGLMYRKQGKFRIGFTVRTPTYYTIKEKYSDEGRSRFDPNLSGTVDEYDIAFDGRTEYSIVTPSVLSMGGSFQIADFLTVSGDAEYTDWRQMKFDTPNSSLDAENRLIQKLYRSTINLRGGAEVTLWDLGIKLRGGIAVKPSPYEGDPSTFDQHYYTAGVGFELDKNVWLNAGYAYGYWKTFRDNYYYGNVQSRTDESVKTNNMIVSLSFQF